MALEEIPNQTFVLLMKRFDTIEAQNKTQIDLIEKHIKEDLKTREIVDRHSTYFGLMSLGLAPIAAYIVSKISGIKI